MKDNIDSTYNPEVFNTSSPIKSYTASVVVTDKCVQDTLNIVKGYVSTSNAPNSHKETLLNDLVNIGNKYQELCDRIEELEKQD